MRILRKAVSILLSLIIVIGVFAAGQRTRSVSFAKNRGFYRKEVLE